MRRVAGLWPRVVAFPNLCRAARRAARGKRHVAGVARFLERLEPEALALQRELQDGTWRPGRPATFRIHDPKERTITAAPFADRVVHHALIDVLEPFFDRRMVFESFACRRGKGTHAAIRHAQRLLRRHDFFLKMDVRQCFASIQPSVVLETVARIIKDARVLGLCETILAGPCAVRAPAPRLHQAPPRRAAAARGLPIGNLTSQWFANLVLDRLDHHVKEQLRIPGYARYMDDFVLFSSDRDRLRAARREVEAYLAEPLRLRPKLPATILAPSWRGLPFLGWQIHRGILRLRPANLHRMRRRLRHRVREFHEGRIDKASLASSLRSVAAHLEQGTTRALRRRVFEDLGIDGARRAPPPRPGIPSVHPRPTGPRRCRIPAPRGIPRAFATEDPRDPGGGSQAARNRVNRGGGWNNTAPNARAANRNANTPENRNDNLGLRPAKASLRPIVEVLPLRETPAPRIPMPKTCLPCRAPAPALRAGRAGAGRRGLASRGS